MTADRQNTVEQLNVSRETMGRLDDLIALLTKWNSVVNLVSSSTMDTAWSRHILDSAQVFTYGKSALNWADIGSGGGFPGLVVAILAAEISPQMQVTLVESDQRKAEFLRHASQNLGLKTAVLAARAEQILPLAADVVSARALAPLPQLCGFAARHLKTGGQAIFLKGKSSATEIEKALEKWDFSLESYTSITDPSAVVLVLKDISHV